MSKEQGIHIHQVLDVFMDQYYQSSMFIAHNMNFDLNIIIVELTRYLKCLEANEDYYSKNRRKIKYIEKCIEDIRENRRVKFYCTMMTTTKLCGLKQLNKYTNEPTNRLKFPKLIELFNNQFKNIEINQDKLHDAFNDVILCILCYYKLKYNKNICDKNKKFDKILNELTTF
jgi:hypothetical protein